MAPQHGDSMTFASLKALGNNAWFKLGARLLMWVAGPALFALIGLALTLRADVNATRDYSQARAKDNEAFQSQTLTNDANTRAQLEILRGGQVAQGREISTISGILTQMNDAKVATRLGGGGGY